MRKEGFVEVETIVFMKRRETFISWEVLFSFLNSVWKLDGSLRTSTSEKGLHAWRD